MSGEEPFVAENHWLATVVSIPLHCKPLVGIHQELTIQIIPTIIIVLSKDKFGNYDTNLIFCSRISERSGSVGQNAFVNVTILILLYVV